MCLGKKKESYLLFMRDGWRNFSIFNFGDFVSFVKLYMK